MKKRKDFELGTKEYLINQLEMLPDGTKIGFDKISANVDGCTYLLEGPGIDCPEFDYDDDSCCCSNHTSNAIPEKYNNDNLLDEFLNTNPNKFVDKEDGAFAKESAKYITSGIEKAIATSIIGALAYGRYKNNKLMCKLIEDNDKH